MKKFSGLILCLLAFFLCLCSVHKYNVPEEAAHGIEVHYIDVGQADSTLIMCGGETMLIDGGNVDDSRLLVSYLKSCDIKSLDYVVCTHSHEDHVGGLSGPMNVFKVKNVYAPKTANDIKAYENFKKAALKNDAEIKTPSVGESIMLGESQVTFLAPVTEDYEDLNDTSVALKVVFGEISFLFTGDATYNAEYDMLETGADLEADVYKVGHHGSESSNSYRFLREVMPKYAVISCGRDNSYGHPHDEALSRLENLDAEIYRTDLHGTVIAKSDGKSVAFETTKLKEASENVITGYIGNRNSMKFHLPSCKALPAEKNRIYFKERKTAVSMGYEPCEGCSP